MKVETHRFCVGTPDRLGLANEKREVAPRSNPGTLAQLDFLARQAFDELPAPDDRQVEMQRFTSGSRMIAFGSPPPATASRSWKKRWRIMMMPRSLRPDARAAGR